MFEQQVIGEPCSGCGGHLPADDDLDGAWERLLAESDALGPLDAVGDPVPEWLVDEPQEFGSCTPSGFLALDLDTATTDPAQLSDHTLIEAMIGFDRIASWAAARQARLLAQLAARRPADKAPHSARWAGIGSEYAPDEAGVALHLSRGTACARIGTAVRLLAVLPETHAVWEAGRIDTPKARAVDDATWMLVPELARAVQDRVLPKAPQQTLAELKAALARAVIAVDPQGAEVRHREARRDRRVVVTPEADGMASLWALLTATQAVGAFTWLTRLARGLGRDDPRSMDTRRADILAALLTGRPVTHPDPDSDITEAAVDAPASPAEGGDESTPASGAGRPVQPVAPGKPLIQVVIPYSTLTGADDQPCELVGHGPIPASLAREVAADSVWHRLVTDPLSGTLLDHGRTTYHPPAGLADHVRARDVYCRAPGCRRTAAGGELDHIVAWSDGGTTSERNLGGYCAHDHRLKHHAGWQVDADPDGGITWTTPTGHRHTTMPHDYRPDPPPPTAATPDPAPDPSLSALDDPDPPPF
jgi:Domain of unknown function (DUF222)/HNH endonuclease